MGIINGMHHLISMETGVASGLNVCVSVDTGLKAYIIVATGIKGVCYHNLVCKDGQWGCFTLISSGSLY